MDICLEESNIKIKPGMIVKLGRFDTKSWKVGYGWFSYAGNRPFCGWYLTDISNPCNIKPLQLPDLDDIYFMEE